MTTSKLMLLTFGHKKRATARVLTRHSRAPAIVCARGNGRANDPTRFARDFGARGARAATTRE
jgi:hypothetical protein